MCLNIDEKLTREGLKGKKIYKDGLIKVWKMFCKREDKLLSPYHLSFQWEKGWNKSNRGLQTMSWVEKKYGNIHEGIHVFLTREDVRRWWEKWNHLQFCFVIKPVYVKKEDLIACGTTTVELSTGAFKLKEAVFMKVFLKKEDYDKALKGEYSV